MCRALSQDCCISPLQTLSNASDSSLRTERTSGFAFCLVLVVPDPASRRKGNFCLYGNFLFHFPVGELSSLPPPDHHHHPHSSRTPIEGGLQLVCWLLSLWYSTPSGSSASTRIPSALALIFLPLCKTKSFQFHIKMFAASKVGGPDSVAWRAIVCLWRKC